MRCFGHRPGSVNGPMQRGSFRRSFSWSLRAAHLTCPSWRFTIKMITSTCWPARTRSRGESWASGGTFPLMQGPPQGLHPDLRKTPQIWKCWSLRMMSWRVLVKTSHRHHQICFFGGIPTPASTYFCICFVLTLISKNWQTINARMRKLLDTSAVTTWGAVEVINGFITIMGL